MSYKLVVKDAFWQVFGRIVSAICGFVVIKLITPYLGSLRYGDYSTILKYFGLWSALANFGIYVIALKKIGKLKNKHQNGEIGKEKIRSVYSKFFSTRMFMIGIVYFLALLAAYFIPSYTANPYLVWGLPLGMVFSASFMTAGILKAPIQVYWKMHHVTIGLLLARACQLGILGLGIFVWFPNINFEGDTARIMPFLVVIFSVVASGMTQVLYNYFVGKKYLNLKWDFDRGFINDLLKKNWKYGLAYYLSSFHMLMVMVVMSWFYPTIEGFEYVGIWALALKLVEMLLIVPSALGNSIIHKIADYDIKEKLKSFGSLIKFIIWIGGVFLINFVVFNKNIIYFIGGNEYISGEGVARGSDFLLPFFGGILVLSFIKQAFNYLFVSTDNQNKLLVINIFGVTLGALIGLPLLWKFNIMGGLIAQGLLETLFLSGSLWVAYKNNILPVVNFKYLISIILIILAFIFGGQYFIDFDYQNFWQFMIYASILNSLILVVSYKPIKKVMKGIK